MKTLAMGLAMLMIATASYCAADSSGETPLRWEKLPVNLLELAGETTPSFEYFWTMHFIDGQTGVILGDEQTILRTDDGGRTWRVLAKVGVPLRAGAFFLNKDVWFDDYWTGGSTFSRTLDGGAHWEHFKYRSPCKEGDFAFVDANLGWAVRDGKICRTKDGGRTWSLIARPDAYDPSVLSFVDKLHGWVAGENSISSTVDGGLHWRTQFKYGRHGPYSLIINEMTFTNATTGYAWAIMETDGGSVETVLYTHDGGQHWKRSSFNKPDAYELWKPATFARKDNNDVCFTERPASIKSDTETGYILCSHDGGRSFTKDAELPGGISCFNPKDLRMRTCLDFALVTQDGRPAWLVLDLDGTLMRAFLPDDAEK